MKMINGFKPFKNNNLKRAHTFDGGVDIKCPYSAFIPSNGSTIINTTVCVHIPKGYVGMIKGRSSLAFKHNIEVSNAGIIDSGYTKHIKVLLRNFGSYTYEIKEGDSIAQLIVTPVWLENFEEVDELPFSERGYNGFGSSGR